MGKIKQDKVTKRKDLAKNDYQGLGRKCPTRSSCLCQMVMQSPEVTGSGVQTS